jgi:hypothetical protein
MRAVGGRRRPGDQQAGIGSIRGGHDAGDCWSIRSRLSGGGDQRGSRRPCTGSGSVGALNTDVECCVCCQARQFVRAGDVRSCGPVARSGGPILQIVSRCRVVGAVSRWGTPGHCEVAAEALRQRQALRRVWPRRCRILGRDWGSPPQSGHHNGLSPIAWCSWIDRHVSMRLPSGA